MEQDLEQTPLTGDTIISKTTYNNKPTTCSRSQCLLILLLLFISHSVVGFLSWRLVPPPPSTLQDLVTETTWDDNLAETQQVNSNDDDDYLTPNDDIVETSPPSHQTTNHPSSHPTNNVVVETSSPSHQTTNPTSHPITPNPSFSPTNNNNVTTPLDVDVFINDTAETLLDENMDMTQEDGEDDNDADDDAELHATEIISEQTLANKLQDLQPKPHPSIVHDLQTQCPSWTSDFATRYGQQCSYWINRIQSWDQLLDTFAADRVVQYMCRNAASCHGLGDRFAGLFTVMNVALANNRHLRVEWNGLDTVFSPCLMKHKWNATTRLTRSACINDNKYCPGVFTYGKEECGGILPPRVFSSLDRTCIPSPTCNNLQTMFPRYLHTGHVFGCALRALMEPSEQFMQHLVPLQMGHRRIPAMSVRSIIDTIFSRYYVIAIHFRIGDGALVRNNDLMDATDLNYQIPFRCAQTIQSYMEGRRRTTTSTTIHAPPFNTSTGYGEDFTVNGRPVKWFVASDSIAFREMAIKMYGERVIMLDLEPRHISHVADRNNEAVVLTQTVAEWYLLGASNELILNKMGNGLYHGRVSSFPKTAWVYNLKHLFYEAFTCRKRTLPYEGNWRETSGPCHSDLTRGKIALEQPHLQDLQGKFPRLFVRDGIVMGT